jgi:acyl-CoA thioesterase II
MPQVRPPEEGMDMLQLMSDRGHEEGLTKEWGALDVRWLGSTRFGGVEEDPMRPAKTQLWLRVAGRLSDDPMVHLATFAYGSDVSLLGATLSTHPDADIENVQMASLDHTIWFHRPFRADEWWLYDQWSPSAQGARGLAIGRVFTQDGTLVATVAQEGLIRPRP